MKPIHTLPLIFFVALTFSSCSPSIEISTKNYFYKHRKESDQLFELSKALMDSSQCSFSIDRKDLTTDSVINFSFWKKKETKKNYSEIIFSAKTSFSLKNNAVNSDTFLVNHNYFIGQEKLKLLSTTFLHSRYKTLEAYWDNGIFLGFKDNPDFERSPEMIGIFYTVSDKTDMKYSKKLEKNIYLYYLNMGA